MIEPVRPYQSFRISHAAFASTAEPTASGCPRHTAQLKAEGCGLRAVESSVCLFNPGWDWVCFSRSRLSPPLPPPPDRSSTAQLSKETKSIDQTDFEIRLDPPWARKSYPLRVLVRRAHGSWYPDDQPRFTDEALGAKVITVYIEPVLLIQGD
jgi:hypothetical protein